MNHLISKSMSLFSLILLTLLACTSAQAYHCCHCQAPSPSFQESDKIHAIEKFMEHKLSVDRRDIMHIETLEEKGFVTLGMKTLINTIGFVLMDEDGKKCELACQRMQNSVTEHLIEYNHAGKRCRLKLKTELISNLTDTGFKSIVSKRNHPKCE